jgi:predicted MFS family arabinose efflux permease
MSKINDLPGRSAARYVVFLATAMIAISLFLSGYAALKVFENAIEPEIVKRANLIGRSVRSEVGRALAIGIPFNAIAGADQYLSGVIDDFPEVNRITLLDNNGVKVAEAIRSLPENPSTGVLKNIGTGTGNLIISPMLNGNTLVGQVVLEIDKNFVASKIQDILLDVLVLALIAILLSFELVIWTVSNAIGKPLDRIFLILNEQISGVFRHVIEPASAGNMKRVARRLSDRAYDLAERGNISQSLVSIQKAYFSDVRLPLFLYSTATEISGAFLPMYARDAGGPIWLTDELAATAPLIAYLLAIALVSPFSGRISNRIGARNLFLLSVPLTALAMIGVGLGFSVLSISLWHGVMALVYALATVACQEYALRAAPKGEDAQVLGSFLFVILGGAFCGAALGGVLADRIGISSTFFTGAGLAVLSGVLGYLALSTNIQTQQEETSESPNATKLRSGSILSNFRFLALLIGVAGPINIGQSVFIWYITPLALEAEGASFADIGRVIMIYYLVPLFVGPTIARLADGRVGYVPFILTGLIVSGFAMSSLFFWSGFWPIVAVVTLFGFGHSMCEATQYAQAIRVAKESHIERARDTGLATLRVVERLAAIIGLIVAALFLKQFGYVSITVLIGLFMWSGAIIVALAEFGAKVQAQ